MGKGKQPYIYMYTSASTHRARNITEESRTPYELWSYFIMKCCERCWTFCWVVYLFLYAFFFISLLHWIRMDLDLNTGWMVGWGGGNRRTPLIEINTRAKIRWGQLESFVIGWKGVDRFSLSLPASRSSIIMVIEQPVDGPNWIPTLGCAKQFKPSPTCLPFPRPQIKYKKKKSFIQAKSTRLNHRGSPCTSIWQICWDTIYVFQ